MYVTLATGRGYYGSSHVFRELGLDTYVINYAGAVINDTRTDKPIFVTELDNSFVQEILAMADNMNLHAHLYQGIELCMSVNILTQAHIARHLTCRIR